jgi:acyl-CoA thioester hydrolase
MTRTAPQGISFDYGHIEPVFVSFDDLDSMGIVHNTRYAVIVERALTAYWDGLGYTYANRTVGHPDASIAVVEFSIKYKMPVSATGTVGVHFWTTRIGSTSVSYGYRVQSVDGATAHAEGQRVHVRFDPATMRPTPWQDDTRATYESLSGPAAD